MRKITFLILFGFLCSWANFAQVIVGTQSGTSNAMPISSCYNYSYSQQLIHKTDINSTAGDITSISFYYDRTTSTNNSSSAGWTIYLGHTAKTEFSNNDDWVTLANLTQVYTGTVTYPSAGSQMLITFQTPFPYNNIDNLVIAVDENQPGNDCSNYFGKTGAMGAGRSIYYRSDTTNPDPASPPSASARTNFINNVILGGLQESCPRPTNLTITGGTSTTADLSWTENGVATEWEVLYGTAGFNPNTEGTVLLDDDGIPGITVPGLSENTAYDFYVRAICGVDEFSGLVGPVNYNTACGIASPPWMEGFESGFVDQQALGGCWSQSSVTGTDVWTTNSSQTTNNRGPRSGSWNIYLKYSNEDWIFYPLSLTGGTPYELRFYARQDGATGSNASVMASYGTTDTPAAMTNPIIPSSPVVNGDYQEFAEFFTPATSGIYYIGIKGKINGTPWYISLDDISVEEANGCLRPGALTVTDVATTTADVAWAPNGSATEWEVVYGISGFNPLTDGTTVEVSNTPATTLTGLTSNTSYDFYVRTICGTEQSSLSGPKNFRTTCDTISTLPYLENFDTYGTGPDAFPACWERITYTSGSSIWPSIVSGNATSAPNSLKFQSAVGTPTYAISPPFAEDIQNLQVSFMLRREGTSSGTIDVGVMSNPFDTSTFELVQTINPGNNDYTEYEFNLNNVTLSGGNNHIALRQNSTSSVWYYWLDDFLVQQIPTCPKPIDLMVDSVETTTANVSWTAGSSETSWNISWGTPGFTVGSAGELGTDTSTTASYQITDLSPSSGYEFYVQGICGVDDLSIWAGPMAFSTACDAITSLPYLENFDTYGTGPDAFPNCWERITYITGSNIWPSIVSGNATSAPNSLKFQSEVGIPTYAISPPFTEDIQNLQVSFMLRREGTSSGTIDVGVMSNPLDTSTFELVQTINPGDNVYTEYEFNLNNVTLSGGNNHIALRQNSTSSIWYYWLDDFMVQTIPSCPKPTDLTVGVVGETTAEVSWTPGSTETEWDVIYGVAGFDPLTQGTTEVVTGTPETILTGLTSDTGYEFYVRAKCGVDDESILSNVKYFFTGYCQFTSTSTQYFIQSFYTEEGISNITNMNSGQSPNGYGNFTAMEVVTFPTGEFNFTAQFNGTSTYGFNMWIDFNGNMEFEESEKVYASGGYVNGASGTIAIPLVTENGSYRMRIAADYLSTNPSACGSSNYAEVEDYTVVIINAPSCFPPRDLVVAGVTETSVDVSWTPQDSETEWDVIYGAPGFDPETEGIIQNVTGGVPETTITGLTASTEYEFYVRAVCDVDDASIWTGPGYFVTECVALDIPYFLGFEDATPPNVPICTSVQNLGNGNEWEVANVNENGFTGRALRYKWNSNNAANTWFYTQGLNLVEGVDYEISYKYGNNGNAFHEKMKVAFGTSPESSYMINELANYTDITGGTPTVEEIVFTAPADGVYYFGFNAYSPADQFYLFVDDIHIRFAGDCDPVTNMEITDVTDTTVSVSWTASPTAVNGYVVDVYYQGQNPEINTPIISQTVDGGLTSTTITGLEANTSYDVYVTSDCGNGNTTRSQALNVITGNVGIGDNDFAQVNYYPNPVKEQLTITAAISIESVTVYNLLGQSVMKIVPRALSVVLDMSTLASGTYVLKATVADAVSTFKVIKE